MEKNTIEEYLKSILKLQRKKGYVRSVDVAKELGITRPSVSVAVKSLKEEKMVCQDDNGFILLTNTGMLVAEKAYKKQELLTKAFLAMGVNEQDASKDANQIGKVISDESYDCLETFFKTHLKAEELV